MLDSGNTAWLLTSSALVLLMTPGLAFFYGGLTRSKSTLNMMMMSFVSIGIVTLLWVFYGFSWSFGPTVHSLFGNFHYAGLHHLTTNGGAGTADPSDKTGKTLLPGAVGNFATGVPDIVFVAFQLMFAIITIALVSGSIADRVKFSAWCIFSVLWMSIVYFPVAHWVFYFGTPKTSGAGGSAAAAAYQYGSGGWIVNRLGAFDFAGGTAVHINAGAAALALCLVLGKRKGWPETPMRPHNVPSVLLGAGLLWFGWFGFNAGSALLANGLAGQAFINTQIATAIGGLAWIGTEWVRDGKPTTVGFASGAVAGLVAITPACGSINAVGSVVLGIVVGIVCALAVGLKYKLGFDDSLDVVGVHLVGGITGTLFIGFFATSAVSGVTGAAHKGLFYGGNGHQLGVQAIAAASVFAYSFTVAYILGFVIHKTIGFRISEEAEIDGIDNAEHAETAYDFSNLGSGTSTLADAIASTSSTGAGA
jgi:Amt family ammonium transporter